MKQFISFEFGNCKVLLYFAFEKKKIKVYLFATIFLSYSRKRMKRTNDHDIILLREILLFEPWNYKYGSKERGHCWERISESLNQLKDICFKVTQRSVQDHYQTLEKAYKKQRREEDKQSGISPEETEVDVALADIIERFEESQKIHQEISEKQKKKTEEDAAKAEEMRRKSLETFGETMKRKSIEQDENPSTSKRRNTGSDTLKFLQEKTESEIAIRQQEIELRREEIRGSKKSNAFQSRTT